MNITTSVIFIFTVTIVSFSFSQVYGQDELCVNIDISTGVLCLSLPQMTDDDFIIERLATGLEYPTSMVFVGDDILVLEKNSGKVILIQENGIVHNEPVLDVPVMFNGESGLLGINSVQNNVYLYFTESLSGLDRLEQKNSRNVVYQYDWNGKKLTNPILIKDLLSATSYHAGGVIAKGQNNEIYFVIGDQHQHTTFQNTPDNTIYETGSVFKIDTENKNNIELFAMGIRNSFGLAVDPITGYLWDTENGDTYFDEINLIEYGFNSGWYKVMGPVDRDNPDIGGTQSIPLPFDSFVYSDPEFSWYDTVAPTAIAFPDPTGFEKYSDWLFVGGVNTGLIYKFQLNNDRTGFVFSNPELADLVLDDNDKIDEIIFAKGFQGVTDIKFHNGAMYVVVIGDGSIYKIYQPISPWKQHQNGVANKNIVCKPELMPIISKSGSIYCVQPTTALTLIDVVNWSINHNEIPIIELKFQDLSGLDLEYLDLRNSYFTGSNFKNTNISNVNFSNANLSHTDLSNKDLTGTILKGADLTKTNLTGVNLSNKDLTYTILREADLAKTDLTGVNLSNTELIDANLTGADLTGADLTSTILRGANLSDANLENIDFSGMDLSDVNFSGQNLSDKNLDKTILRGADLSNANLGNFDFYGRDLTGANLSGQDLSDNDLRGTVLTDANLSDTNLKNTNLSNAMFLEADFSNANLTGANLSDASFAHSNLSGVNMFGVEISGTNFDSADLSGMDFSVVSNAKLKGVIFLKSNLSNSNFEGTDLSSITFSKIFKNTVNTENLNNFELGEKLFGEEFVYTARIISATPSESDLIVKYMVFNNFNEADLENANFQNSNLIWTNFKSANLANADLSGANLSNSNLSGANLTDADLNGADISGAYIDEGTILKCKNHTICVK